MNFAEFHAAVTRLANGRCHASGVEAMTYSAGHTKLKWTAYIEGVAPCNFLGASPEACLATIALPEQNDLGSVEPLPEPTPEPEDIPL